MTAQAQMSNGTYYADVEEDDDSQPEISLLLQPETKPISYDQLAVEVKGIYAGLVMVEAKCYEVDAKQAQQLQASQNMKGDRTLEGGRGLDSHQWNSLIALHKQLLHEHHDLFLASQHPSASRNLSVLAEKYAMPARIWRHGIHDFLEILRRRLDDSQEFMLTFKYIAYSTMALLYETIPAFEDAWVECLGDPGRYRMVIEQQDPHYKSIPAFENTWVECLGDLGRYRMAIEQQDPNYKTIPAFEDTWVECLGDLNRYCTAIEQRDPKHPFESARSEERQIERNALEFSDTTRGRPLWEDFTLRGPTEAVSYFPNDLFDSDDWGPSFISECGRPGTTSDSSNFDMLHFISRAECIGRSLRECSKRYYAVLESRIRRLIGHKR